MEFIGVHMMYFDTKILLPFSKIRTDRKRINRLIKGLDLEQKLL